MPSEHLRAQWRQRVASSETIDVEVAFKDIATEYHVKGCKAARRGAIEIRERTWNVDELRAHMAVVMEEHERYNQEGTPFHSCLTKMLKGAYRYTFDVDYSDDKDLLMTGEMVSGTRRVIVEAPTMNEGALIAEQMVAARGWEPTECRAVDWTDMP